MAQNIMLLDGKAYDVDILELKRKFAVTDTKNSGRVMDYSMHRDIIGTFYNYTLKIAPRRGGMASYNSFYEAVSNPSYASHSLQLPFGEDTLTFQAYVTQGEDELKIRNGKNFWGTSNGLSVNFIAMEPQRRR